MTGIRLVFAPAFRAAIAVNGSLLGERSTTTSWTASESAALARSSGLVTKSALAWADFNACSIFVRQNGSSTRTRTFRFMGSPWLDSSRADTGDRSFDRQLEEYTAAPGPFPI